MYNPFIPAQPISMGIPIGSVTAFAGYVGPPMSSPPSVDNYNTVATPQGFGAGTIELQGWMVCDGRQLNCHAYPALFLTIGFLYNQPGDQYKPGDPNPGNDNPAATFRLPDYRGYFLRMVSGVSPWPSGSNPDPDADMRYLTYDTSKMVNGIGTIQQDALETHQHAYYKAESAPVVAQTGNPPSAIPPPPAPENALTSIPTDNTNNPPGKIRVSTETRAKNMYVYYLIKYA